MCSIYSGESNDENTRMIAVGFSDDSFKDIVVSSKRDMNIFLNTHQCS